MQKKGADSEAEAQKWEPTTQRRKKEGRKEKEGKKTGYQAKGWSTITDKGCSRKQENK